MKTLIAASVVVLFGGLSIVAAENLILQLDAGPCEVPIVASSSVTVAANGDITVDVDETNVSCLGSPAGTPLTVNLSVTPPTVNSGDDVTVTWDVTGFVNGVTACTPIGGTTAWQTAVDASPSAGSGVYPVSSNTTFTLNCDNGGDQASRSVNVQGGSGGGSFPTPAFCDAAPLPRTDPTSGNRAGTSITASTFEDVWGAWPGQSGLTNFLAIPRGTYVALGFRTPSTVGRAARIAWVGGPDVASSYTITVSQCPGNFDPADQENSGCLRTSGSQGASIFMAVGGNTSSCNLQPDTVYFFNVVTAKPATVQQTDCHLNACFLISSAG